MEGEKRRRIGAIELCRTYGEEIEDEYLGGKNRVQLAKVFGCAPNTMMVCIGILGYPVEDWAKEQVRNALYRIATEKKKRIKIEY